MTNDNFADAIEVVIPTAGGTYTSPAVPSAAFTSESGEPAAVGASNNRSAWWYYLPLASGTATIHTGASFNTSSPGSPGADTQMGIYTGSSVGALTTVASDQDSGGAHGGKTDSSWLQMAVTGGVTYRIQVGTWGSTALTYVLSVTGPATVAPTHIDVGAANVETLVSGLTDQVGSAIVDTVYSGANRQMGGAVVETVYGGALRFVGAALVETLVLERTPLKDLLLNNVHTKRNGLWEPVWLKES